MRAIFQSGFHHFFELEKFPSEIFQSWDQKVLFFEIQEISILRNIRKAFFEKNYKKFYLGENF